MTKPIIPYILLALCMLSACNTAFDEPDAMASGESEMLTLTVSAFDIVESNDPSTRSEEMPDNGITTFQDDDRVGLIVLDSEGNLLADNVPYIYDENDWTFWEENPDGKQPVYFDAAMSTYIVYYPYDKEVDGSKNVDDIRSKNVFEPQNYQTTELLYRKADILVWTSEGKAIHNIKAEMKHVYDSFSFRIDIKWDLVPIAEEVVYEPMRETLKDFKIEFIPDENPSDKITLFDSEDDESNNRIYLDNDGYYRYLMSRGQKGTISWHYTYRYITFSGKRKIDTNYSGRRYVNYETADMGELPGPNMQVSDFYCSRGNTGYVFPWDAAFRIDETIDYKKIPFANHHCIGLVIRLGQHINDISDYTQILEGKIS